MKSWQCTANRFAAGITLILAAILIIACGSVATPQPPVRATKTATVTATTRPADTPIPLTATPTPTPAPATPTRSSTAPRKATPEQDSTPDTPTPTASEEPDGQTGTGQVEVYETTITLPTYPIWDYLVEQVDPLYNLPAFYFNRPQYEADSPTPEPVDYTGVVLENPYLRLTFLPELGGRLYSAVVKATGQEIFYHNPVVKPSRYGVLQPAEANWWLATGGMEWAYPTQEHGYRWGVPWTYEVNRSATGAGITLSDTAPDRVGAEIQVTLPADRAVFTVAPTLINPGPQPVPVQFWLNAALTLAPQTMSSETQFTVPADRVVVHSRGEEGWLVPGPHQKVPWPQMGETDLSNYSNWANYLGFFVPNMDAPFIGAYNPETNLGVVRLVEPGQVPGNKVFAFGLAFPDRSYTDNNSQYFELWGGANTGFWPEDDVKVPAGGSLQWQEQWWPLAGLDGITWANEQAAIYLVREKETYRLSLLLAEPGQGKLTVLAEDEPILAEPFSATPDMPLHWSLPALKDSPHIHLSDQQGITLLDYCPNCKEPTAFCDPLDFDYE